MPPLPPWVSDPAGPVAREIVPVYWIMFVFAIIVLAIVDGGLIYAGIKFRERPGHVAKQFHGHNMLELTWTVIPTLMVLGFSVLSFQKLLVINNVDENAEMVIQVEARQWSWQYSYPDTETFKTTEGPLVGFEELHIPVDTKVKLVLTSTDVIHDFFVPNLGGKMDAVPGRTTQLWLQADRPGSYKGQCAEFCGDGHADMLITVVVHPKNEYGLWAKKAVEDANRLLDPATKAGRELFRGLACANCHTIRGVSAGKFPGAPELTKFASNPDIAGVLPVTEENLKRWLANPPGVKPGTAMPSLGLDETTINALTQFLLTLK